ARARHALEALVAQHGVRGPRRGGSEARGIDGFHLHAQARAPHEVSGELVPRALAAGGAVERADGARGNEPQESAREIPRPGRRAALVVDDAQRLPAARAAQDGLREAAAVEAVEPRRPHDEVTRIRLANLDLAFELRAPGDRSWSGRVVFPIW